MVKLNMHVTFAKGYKGKPQLSREIVSDDGGSIDRYVCTTFLASTPKNPSELEALTSLYESMNPVTGAHCMLYVKGLDKFTHDIYISDICSKGKDITVIADLSHVDGGASTKEGVEYLEFQCHLFGQGVKLYREWQQNRLKNAHTVRKL